MKFLQNTSILLVLIFFHALETAAQGFPEAEILKKHKGIAIKMDAGNEDGVFQMQGKKSQKWGMYQWMYEGTKIKELVPMEYDSLKNYPFNGNFTAVYNGGKVGFYLAVWSYEDMAKQSVPCLYDDYQRFNSNGITYLAVSKDGKWGWVDWLTGEEKTEFIYETKDDLPAPAWEQQSWPE